MKFESKVCTNIVRRWKSFFLLSSISRRFFSVTWIKFCLRAISSVPFWKWKGTRWKTRNFGHTQENNKRKIAKKKGSLYKIQQCICFFVDQSREENNLEALFIVSIAKRCRPSLLCNERDRRRSSFTIKTKGKEVETIKVREINLRTRYKDCNNDCFTCPRSTYQ